MIGNATLEGLLLSQSDFVCSSKLKAGGNVDRIAFEGVLGIELAVPLGKNGERLRGIGAGGKAHDWADTINPRFK
jgi:hypothetical protein